MKSTTYLGLVLVAFFTAGSLWAFGSVAHDRDFERNTSTRSQQISGRSPNTQTKDLSCTVQSTCSAKAESGAQKEHDVVSREVLKASFK